MSLRQIMKMRSWTSYNHHGIYLGVIDGKKMVTDFGVVSNYQPVIRELDAFLSEFPKRLHRRIYKDESKLLPLEETLKIAEKYYTCNCPYEPFNFFTNNCEHYASLLKTRKRYSTQVDYPYKFGKK